MFACLSLSIIFCALTVISLLYSPLTTPVLPFSVLAHAAPCSLFLFGTSFLLPFHHIPHGLLPHVLFHLPLLPPTFISDLYFSLTRFSCYSCLFLLTRHCSPFLLQLSQIYPLSTHSIIHSSFTSIPIFCPLSPNFVNPSPLRLPPSCFSSHYSVRSHP